MTNKESKNISIAFLGFGEVSYAFCLELNPQNCSLYAFDHRISLNDPTGSLKQKRAEECNLTLSDNIDSIVPCGKFIISAVTPASAEHIAESAIPFISNDQIFLDFNSLSPSAKMTLGLEFEKRGRTYIDCSLMNSPVDVGLRSLILFSGAPNSSLNALKPFFNLRWIGNTVGQAAAVKMCQSIVTKGYQTLLWEQALLARSWQVEEHVMDALTDLLDTQTFTQWRSYALTSSVVHARRRSKEMEMAIKTLEEAELPSRLSRAARDCLLWLSSMDLRHHFGGKRPERVEEVVELVQNILRMKS